MGERDQQRETVPQRWRRRAGEACDCSADLPDCSGPDCSGPDCGCSLLLLALWFPAWLPVLLGAFRASAVDPHTRPDGLGARAASRLVRSYQVNLSAQRGPVCNLTPSCSRYGLQVLAEAGLLRGARLIRQRLRDCREVGRGRREV